MLPFEGFRNNSSRNRSTINVSLLYARCYGTYVVFLCSHTHMTILGRSSAIKKTSRELLFSMTPEDPKETHGSQQFHCIYHVVKLW
jgi:hypothetical protein